MFRNLEQSWPIDKKISAINAKIICNETNIIKNIKKAKARKNNIEIKQYNNRNTKTKT